MKTFPVGFTLVTMWVLSWSGPVGSQEATFEGLSYRLHRPRGSESYPLLVNLHGAGGGWR